VAHNWPIDPFSPLNREIPAENAVHAPIVL
jgi:hypothetical protein